MTASTMPLLLTGGSFSVAGSAAVVYFAIRADGGPLGPVLGAYLAWLDRRASFLILPYPGARVAQGQAAAASAAVVLLVTTRSEPWGLLVPLVLLVPPWVLSNRHRIRVRELERQLDSWLLMLANALKATSSVSEAIASTVALVPKPFSEELDLLVKEIRLGVPLDRALNTAACRINSTVISGALATVVVARQTGGDLPHTLEQASAALRESARLEGVLRTKTAEGRGQVLVLASMPFVLSLMIAWLDRSWFDPMLNHHYGRAILVGCSLVWASAALWAYRIVQADL